MTREKMTWINEEYIDIINLERQMLPKPFNENSYQDYLLAMILHFIMTSSNENIFRVTGLFVRGIHQSPVNSPHKGQWRGTLMFSLIWARTNSWANNGDAGDLRRHSAQYDVIEMSRRGLSLRVSKHKHHFQYNRTHAITVTLLLLSLCSQSLETH